MWEAIDQSIASGAARVCTLERADGPIRHVGQMNIAGFVEAGGK
jgi:hypothetical protein